VEWNALCPIRKNRVKRSQKQEESPVLSEAA